jgi:hypothetical protein
MKVGGKKGGAGGVRGGAGAGGVGKAGKAFGARVDKAESLVSPVGVTVAADVGAVDPVMAQALDIARQLKSGQLKSKEEATKKLVADILREKVRMQSKALTSKIADQLQDDPRINQALERLWSKAE